MIESILHFFGICADHTSHINVLDLLKMLPFIGGGLAAFWLYIRSFFGRCRCCRKKAKDDDLVDT